MKYQISHDLDVDVSGRPTVSGLKITPADTTPAPIPPVVTPSPLPPDPSLPQPSYPFVMVPSTDGQPWMKTLQGFGTRPWPETILQEEFAWSSDPYKSFVDHLGQWAFLNLSMVGWGYTGHFPHPKSFPGTYTPACTHLYIGGKSPSQFSVDLAARNASIEINLYTTPSLDNVSASWNDSIGMPPPGDNWDPGNFENLRNSLNAMKAAGIARWTGVYLDLCAGPYISGANLRKAVLICKQEYGKRVVLNTTYADVINFQYCLNSVPELDSYDTVFVEGLYKDGRNGYVAEQSKRVMEYMASPTSNPKKVGFAGIIEADSGTTAAQMQAPGGQPYKDWIDGYYGYWDPYKMPNWRKRVEHNVTEMLYVGTYTGA